MTRSCSSRLCSLSLAFALGATGALFTVGGCAGQGDIDRTQPDKIDKSIFFNPDGSAKVWYYRETLVGFPPTASWSFEGMQGQMQKVRFEIQEKFLLGYRAYEYVPGFANDFTGGVNNTDTPLLIYNIKSHFDVKREYNPATGEQTNVIGENTSDRPWDQRQYMRVDWSTNAAEKNNFGLTPMSMISGDDLRGDEVPANWYVSEVDTAKPEFKDRPIVNGNVIDFVARVNVTPDYYACINVWDAPFDDNFPDCGPADVEVRHSMLAVKPSTYEPLEYPDNYPLLDDSGNQIQLIQGNYPCSPQMIQSSGGTYSGADCGPAQVGGFSKFGYFRTIRQNYDRRVGNTEMGRKYYANRWNIWKDAYNRNPDGSIKLKADNTPDLIPLETREPKPITYYTNLEFSDDPMLLDQAKAVVSDWSLAFRKTIAALRVTANGNTAAEADIDARVGDVPEMVVLKQNSCNLKDFKEHLDKYGDLADKVQQATGLKAADLDKTHLAQACSVVEQATEGLKDDDAKKFSWQRTGDLRYSFFHWIDRPQAAGPLGYGPSSADPETGEIISATAFNYGGALDTYAETAAETVELLNGDITVDELLSGKTIADVLKDTAAARQASNTYTVTPEARTRAASLLRRGQPPGSAPQLIPIPTGAVSSKLDLLKGTSIERELMTPEIVAAMLPELRLADIDKLSPDSLTPEQREHASPLNWLSDKGRAARRERFQRLAMNGCVYLGEFADDAIYGLALSLKQKGLSGDALFRELRTLIFRGLADHEMGHTMGLRHNFAGSSDALNYGDKFWQIRTQMPSSTWDANSLSEYQYSTVMDYGSRFNSDVHGLGKYDMAAIRFGYGMLVDVMPDTTGYTDTNSGAFVQETGEQLANDLFFKDYKRLPEMLGGADKLANAGVMRYKTIMDDLRAGYQDPRYRGGYFLTTERPYKFCSDEFVGNLECKQWDFGANQQEIVDNTIDMYKNYYVFTAFKRGKTAWNLNSYINRLLDRYYARYTEAFQFYFFYGDYLSSLNQSGSYQNDLGDDLLKASIDSLNALGEVMQTPEPGMHCPTQISPDVMVLPASSGPNACLSGEPFMNIRIPDGKPYFIDFSQDYYYRITRAGSLYEKLAAIISLTSTDARFYRVDTFADSNNYSINYYRVFKDEMLNLLGGVIRNEPASYGGYVMPGSQARYQSTPVVDLSTWGKVRYDTPPYMQPTAKRVDTPVNKTIRYYALAFGLANLNSTWDSTLDLANYATVTVKGANDDVSYGTSTVVHEFTHPQSGLVYRAPMFDTTREGIGVQLIDELNSLVGQAGVARTLPAKYGYYSSGTGLPDWQTAKKNLADAQASGDQTAYDKAFDAFQSVDYLVAYRVDLLDDLRFFKRMFAY